MAQLLNQNTSAVLIRVNLHMSAVTGTASTNRLRAALGVYNRYSLSLAPNSVTVRW